MLLQCDSEQSDTAVLARLGSLSEWIGTHERGTVIRVVVNQSSQLDAHVSLEATADGRRVLSDP